MFHLQQYNLPNLASPQAEGSTGPSQPRRHSSDVPVHPGSFNELQNEPIQPYAPPTQDEVRWSAQDIEEFTANPSGLEQSQSWPYSSFSWPGSPASHGSKEVSSGKPGETGPQNLLNSASLIPKFPRSFSLESMVSLSPGYATEYQASKQMNLDGCDALSSQAFLSADAQEFIREMSSVPHKKATAKRAASPGAHADQEEWVPKFMRSSLAQPTARPSFFPDFKPFIQSLLSQCTYGKNLAELLTPEKGFKVVSQNGDLKLLNYSETPQGQPPFKGVCNELAYSVGKQVQRLLGDNFEVQIGKGACSEYFPFGVHYFLLAWPKEKNAEVLQALSTSQRIPEACMLIDPSFKQMIPAQVNENRDRYQVSSVHDLEYCNPENVDHHFKPARYPIQLPIGLLPDVAPELVGEYGRQSMVYLEFDHPAVPGDPPLVIAKFQRDPNQVQFDVPQNLFQKVSPHSHFWKFYNKISHDLRPNPVDLRPPECSNPLPASPSIHNLPASPVFYLPEDWDGMLHSPSFPSSPKAQFNPFASSDWLIE
jgi:hypothetical protein